jgi:hypothetical protein
MGGNVCQIISNRVGGIFRVMWDEILIFWDFFRFLGTQKMASFLIQTEIRGPIRV